jgi:hypothetical protein
VPSNGRKGNALQTAGAAMVSRDRGAGRRRHDPLDAHGLQDQGVSDPLGWDLEGQGGGDALDAQVATSAHLARPVTPHTAASAMGFADASSSRVENFKQWATPQRLGGPSKASRRAGKEFAPGINDFRTGLKEEVPGYGTAITTRDGFSAASTALGVASTGAAASGFGAPAAPALAMASSGAKIAAGGAELGAGAALSQRPPSPTGRGMAQQGLHFNDGTRKVVTGTAAFAPVPGAGTAAGLAYDHVGGGAAAKTRDQVNLVEGVRQDQIKHGRRAGKNG